MVVNVKPMDEKNKERVAIQQPKENIKVVGKKAESFLGDIKSEFKKITWTSKEELKDYTRIVIATTFVCGFGVYFVDLFIRGFLNALEAVVRLIFG
jgi:preprotein translocase subunit SecE